MDLRERFHDVREIIESIVEAKMASVWISLPCIVDSVHSSGTKATFQPAIKANVKQPDGSIKQVDMPLLQDVPMQFPGGGGVSMTFPVKKGDEALVIFSSRPADSWKQSGGVQAQIDARMHDLSDGFAMMGFRSSPNAQQNVNSDATEIRSDDGNTKISLKGNEVKVVAGSASSTVTPSAITHDVGGTSVHIASGRVDLGGTGGVAVQTTGGPSSKVFAVV